MVERQAVEDRPAGAVAAEPSVAAQSARSSSLPDGSLHASPSVADAVVRLAGTVERPA